MEMPVLSRGKLFFAKGLWRLIVDLFAKTMLLFCSLVKAIRQELDERVESRPVDHYEDDMPAAPWPTLVAIHAFSLG